MSISASDVIKSWKMTLLTLPADGSEDEQNISVYFKSVLLESKHTVVANEENEDEMFQEWQRDEIG